MEQDSSGELLTEYRYPPQPTMHGLLVDCDFDPDEDTDFCGPFE